MKFLIGTAAGAVVIATAGAGATTVVWLNGDFELGSATWSFPSSTTFGDFDGDGDQEAFLAGCGDGTWQISRGATKGVVLATTPLSFDIEEGELVYDVRMILLNTADPGPWVNNLYSLDPTQTVQPDWFDDDVLSWVDWGGASGHIVLDPVAANAYNIAGWSTMTAAERADELAGYTHMTIVVYACASGYAVGTAAGATIDNVAWEL